MATEKVSIVLDLELAQEARRRAGPRGLSRLINKALRQYLQALRLHEFEAKLAAEHGPLPLEAQQRAAAIEWPV